MVRGPNIEQLIMWVATAVVGSGRSYILPLPRRVRDCTDCKAKNCPAVSSDPISFLTVEVHRVNRQCAAPQSVS